MTRARLVRLAYGGATWNFTPSGTTVDGHQYYFESLDGWFGGVGVRADDVDRLGHGQFETEAWRTSRALTLKVSVIVPEPWDRDPLVRRMSGILGDGDYGSITVENDLTLTSRIRLDGEIGIVENGDREVVLQIPLVAPDPFLYSPWRESILRPADLGVGFEFPPFSRNLGNGPILTFGTAVNTTEWVWNDGNADSYPQYEVVGDFPGGFAVGLGDKQVAYPWATFPDMPVLVDMAGALSVSGVDQSHMLSSRGWKAIGPSSIEVPTLTPLQGGSGWATVRHRDTYI